MITILNLHDSFIVFLTFLLSAFVMSFISQLLFVIKKSITKQPLKTIFAVLHVLYGISFVVVFACLIKTFEYNYILNGSILTYIFTFIILKKPMLSVSKKLATIVRDIYKTLLIYSTKTTNNKKQG
jgi:hypothetical protein